MLTDGLISHIQTDEAIKKVKTRKAKVKSKQASLGLPNDSAEFKTKTAKSPKIPHIPLDFETKIFPNVDLPKLISLTLPIRTVSEANCFEPWQKKHKRHKNQKKIVFFALLEVKHLIKLPCKIKYIRYAPKELDVFENLPMSFKYINDSVCAEITGDYRPGRADGTKEITQSCDQVKSKQYAVKIIIEF
jgi:hypothetical protein